MQPFPGETGSNVLDEWRNLEQRSLHCNPFLSPAFLYPQWQFSVRSHGCQLLTVTDREGHWIFAGLFDRVRGTRRLPLPHLQAVETDHTFQTGCLIDANQSQSATEAVWTFLRQQNLHGLTFPMFPSSSPIGNVLRDQCERSQTVSSLDDIFLRATVTPVDGIVMSSKRAKSLRRGRRFLEKMGQVSLRIDSCSTDDMSAVERFLFLESLGWKGESQSALACRLNEVQAFKATARVLAQQNRIHFAELTIDERVIASMCLFQSKSEYYAFKIGWDQQFERGCPGFLLAAELQKIITKLPQCQRIDSCACPGSFLDHVWPGRMPISTALFATTKWGSLAVRGAVMARGLYRQIRSCSWWKAGDAALLHECDQHQTEGEEPTWAGSAD